MAARFRFLSAEGGAEAIDLAESSDAGLAIQLATLSQICGVTEIAGLKKGAGSLNGGWSQDGGINQNEPVVIEIVSAGADDLGPDLQDGILAGRAQPEVAMVH